MNSKQFDTMIVAGIWLGGLLIGMGIGGTIEEKATNKVRVQAKRESENQARKRLILQSCLENEYVKNINLSRLLASANRIIKKQAGTIKRNESLLRPGAKKLSKRPLKEETT